jgi:hypothetical protein
VTGGDYSQPGHGLDPAHRAEAPLQQRVIGLDPVVAYRSTWCHAAGHISSRTRGDTVGGAASDQPKRRVSWKNRRQSIFP